MLVKQRWKNWIERMECLIFFGFFFGFLFEEKMVVDRPRFLSELPGVLRTPKIDFNSILALPGRVWSQNMRLCKLPGVLQAPKFNCNPISGLSALVQANNVLFYAFRTIFLRFLPLNLTKMHLQTFLTQI